MILVELALLFQNTPPVPRPQVDAEAFMEEARQRHSQIRKAQEYSAKYQEQLLRQRHLDFIHAFNLYLDGYRRGVVNVQNLRDATKAFDRLRKTEGFKEYANDHLK